MDKAEQLRRGNIIAFNDGSTDIVKVDYVFRSEGIWFVQWVKISGDGSFNEGNSIIDDFKPIPLTPEILEQCGCSQGNDQDMWRNSSGVWLTKVNNENKYFIQGFRAGHYIQFLHQYQNAVFALTGEELQVNLKEKMRV